MLAVGVAPGRAVHDGQVQSGGRGEQGFPVVLDVHEVAVEPGDPGAGACRGQVPGRPSGVRALASREQMTPARSCSNAFSWWARQPSPDSRPMAWAAAVLRVLDLTRSEPGPQRQRRAQRLHRVCWRQPGHPVTGRGCHGGQALVHHGLDGVGDARPCRRRVRLGRSSCPGRTASWVRGDRRPGLISLARSAATRSGLGWGISLTPHGNGARSAQQWASRPLGSPNTHSWCEPLPSTSRSLLPGFGSAYGRPADRAGI